MEIKVYEAKDKVSESDLDALESRLRIQLPSQYRAWLLQYNGGMPDPSTFRFKNESGPYTESSVAWFNAVGSKYNNIETTYQTFVLGKRIPRDFLPIATDPGGNKIVLGISGADLNKVYFWDHEEEEEEGTPPSKRNMHLIADSFDEFLAGLY